MENKTVFIVTLKGQSEIKRHTRQLSEEVLRVLALVDDESNVEILSRRAAPSLRTGLRDILHDLEQRGYIQDKNKAGSTLKIATPKPAAASSAEEAEDLDFTAPIAPSSRKQTGLSAQELERLKADQEAAREKAEAEVRAKQEIEAARNHAEQEAAKARAEAESIRKQAGQMAAKARAAIEATRHEAERKAAEAEAARKKAEQEAARVKSEVEAHAREEAEAARRKAEEEVAKARAEAEAARQKAEQEAAKVRAEMEAARIEAERKAAEAEAKAKQEAEAARKQAEEEARARQEAEIAKAKAEAEARAKQEAETARLEAERRAAEAAAKAKQEAEAARKQAEQEAARAKAEAEARAQQEAEAARIRAEQEIARVKAEAEEQIRLAAQARQEAEAALAARTKAEAARSTIATVLFFDVVGYTKQSVSKQIELKAQFNQLVSEFIKGVDENQRIILDTGDGAAIGFLQHPEDAIEAALKFRHTVTANGHRDYPELKVRIGIHLGPINVVKDMNGQSNMVGDGINDAQRIMSFATSDCIYISRSYYDVVSRLSADYAKLFQYRGVKNDKHGRQHQVYEAIAEEAQAVAVPQAEAQEAPAISIQIEPSLLAGLGQPAPQTESPAPQKAAQEEAPEEPIILTLDMEPSLLAATEQPSPPAKEPAKAPPATEPPAAKEQPAAPPPKSAQELEAEAQAAATQKAQEEAEAARKQAEQEAAKKRKEEDERKLAEEEARKLAEAERRAREQTEAQAKADAERIAQPEKARTAAAPRERRKPFPLGKLIGAVLLLLPLLAAVLPYVWPMQGYIPQLEKKLSAQLQQPVRIANLKSALLPLPKLQLQDVTVGAAGELKAANVTLNFSIPVVFSGSGTINSMEVDNLALNAAAFRETLAWLQAAGADANYPITRLVLKHAHADLEGIALPPLNGEATWDGKGNFTQVTLRSEDGKLDLDLQGQPAQWQVALRLKGALPWLSDVAFDELEAQGNADTNGVELTSLNASLYGGKLMGSARLDWQKDWQMRGQLNAKMLELAQAIPQAPVEGALDGDATLLMTGATLTQLAEAPRLEGNFAVTKGVIGKMDLVETAATRRESRSGRTHFDELSGALLLENGTLHLRRLSLGSGGLNASGSLDVSAAGHLSGRLSAELKMRGTSTALSLGGTLAEPVLSAN